MRLKPQAAQALHRTHVTHLYLLYFLYSSISRVLDGFGFGVSALGEIEVRVVGAFGCSSCSRVPLTVDPLEAAA